MIDFASRIFARAHLDIQRLEDYGFQKGPAGYRYGTDILEKEFRVVLDISFAGKLQGHVYETMNGEEYRNLWIEGMHGAYVGKVREAYVQVLQAIREHCYVDDYFSTPQANRLAERVLEKYGVTPEFLWKRFPAYGVFRNQQNRKWFGIIMYVDRNKITEGEERKVDVLAIKADLDRREDLLSRDGIYPAYHLNKKNWISILLEDRVSDVVLMQLIEESYRLVQGSGKRK